MSEDYELEFNHLTSTLLTAQEREKLHKGLRHYQRSRDITQLAKTVREICNTAEKARLLDFIRVSMSQAERNQFDRLTGYQREGRITGMTANTRPAFFGRITTPPSSVLASATERLITIYGSRGDTMGFSVRGGSEFGLGIYVSNVKAGTPASKAGLRAGDNIITANGIDFHCVANSSAVKVLSSSALLNLVVVRCGKIPEWKIARERVLWYDVGLCRIVSTPPISETTKASAQANVFVDRKVVIAIGQESDFIGLNIRGGKEYGIGIYVSRVDAGGLASQVGLSAGDQIVKVNEIDCTSITHSDAVDALRSSAHLIITIRSVGKYPVFKELYAEYTWSDATGLGNTSTSVTIHSRLITGPGDNTSGKYSHRTQTRESSIDIAPLSVRKASTDNTINTADLEDAIEELDDCLEVESKLYPGDKDIMFRRSYEDSWKDIDTVSNSHAHLDSLTKSWPADKADSISRYHQDSDLSDEVIDYTTFLEQTALKKQHEVKIHERQVNQATEFLNDNDNVVVETIVEEEFTSFPSQIQPSTHSESDVFLSENTDRVYSQVQDLTGKARPVVNSHTNSNASSSSHSSPIYSTVDKRSRSSRSESFGSEKISGVIGNGIYRSNSNKSHNDGDRIESDVIASQIKRLEARKSHLGSWEITRMAEDSLSTKSSSGASYESQDKHKTGTWTSLKNKLKGSLRIMGPGHKKRSSMPTAEAFSGNGQLSPTGSLQQKGVFERSFGSQILNTQMPERYNLMGMLEDHARALLTEDEYKAVLRHIHNYHENKQLDRLVELLLAILDKPEKQLLLVDVRNVIAPSHIERFDSLVAHCNIEGNDKWMTNFNSEDEIGQTHLTKNAKSDNSKGSSMSYDVSNHHLDIVDHIHSFSKRDFEHVPGALEVVIFETDDAENRKSPLVEDGEEIVYISKHKTILGLKLCGGRNDLSDQSIRVKQITAGSAASDDKRLQPGVEITKVDGNPLEGMSHEEAESMLQIAFSKKIPVNLGIQIRRATHM